MSMATTLTSIVNIFRALDTSDAASHEVISCGAATHLILRVSLLDHRWRRHVAKLSVNRRTCRSLFESLPIVACSDSTPSQSLPLQRRSGI